MDPVGKMLGNREERCPHCKKHIMSDLGYWNCNHCGFECSYFELQKIQEGGKFGKETKQNLVDQYVKKGWM